MDEKATYIIFHYYDKELEQHIKVAKSLYHLQQGNLSRTSDGRGILWNFCQAPPMSVDISTREMTWNEFRDFNNKYSGENHF